MRFVRMADTRGRDDNPLGGDQLAHNEGPGQETVQTPDNQLSRDGATASQSVTNKSVSSGFSDAKEHERESYLPQGGEPHSVDQEIMNFQNLDLTTDTTDITSEFLTLPSKLSGRSSPSVLHRLHHFLTADFRLGLHSSQETKCRQRSNSDSRLENQSSQHSRLSHRYSYDSRIDYYSSHSPSLMFSSSDKSDLNPSNNPPVETSAGNLQGISTIDFPKVGFSDVSIVIDSLDQEISEIDDLAGDIPDILISNNQDRETALGAQGNWIGLETRSKSLLSPRSSNGSICSFRSSNADSAIEMLTPEEEMSEIHDFPHHSEAWDSDLMGAKAESTLLSSQDLSFEKSQLSDVWRQVMFNKSKSSPSKLCNDQSQTLDTFSGFYSVSQSNIVPPSVIVSDHSTSTREDKGSQTEAGSDNLQDQLDLMDKRFLSFNRSQSNSSISSTDTSLSFQSDSSQDVDDSHEPGSGSKKKQSSWKKIRNIVHWTPFIQQFKRRRYPWIQLAGHQGNFHAGEQPGAILKKYDAQECKSFHKLMKDVLRPYVPEFRGEASKDGQHYIQLQDLLCEFEAPCVMDVKMGCRTYLEEELTKAREKPTLRKDMYQKMVEVDPTAPTAEENSQKAITKPRYMQWRDDMSSSVELGFRIEGVRTSDGASVKNFKKTKQRSCIKETLRQFVRDNESVANTYLRRLKSIRATQEASSFFKSHEIIGSSLLFVHDKTGQASIWMIDFGKTVPLSENVTVNHKSKWEEGNHEDGYLLGISSLIELFEDLAQEKLHSSKDTSSDNVTDRTTERTTESVESSLTESEQKDSEGVSSTDKNSNQNDQSENTAKEPVPTDSLKESHC